MSRVMIRATLAAALAASSGGAMGFENAKVLPKGVRNIDVRSVNTDLSEKTDGNGNAQPLAKPLNQQLTFDKIAKGEEQLKGDQLRAFLKSNNFQEDQSVGEFTADLKGHVSVIAPIASYGVSEKLTLALAAPIYDAATSIDVGFQPNENAKAFLAALAKPENNQTQSAREAADKLNNAVQRLNDKLIDNHYAALDDWHAQGLGDMTLAAKYRAVDQSVLGVATTTGVVLPTGRQDDPDILNDIAFGDGQYDVFGQVAVDETVVGDVLFNQFAKYTVQLPGNKNLRAQTPDEKVEVGYVNTDFKLGDKVDAGASVTYQPRWGLLTGVGGTYFRKYGDTYRGDELSPETKSVLEDGTDQSARNAEFMLGYSTVPLYQDGHVAVPLEAKFTYVKQVASRNMPVSDIAQFDLNLFF